MRFLCFISLLLSAPVWAQTKVTVRVLDSQNAPVVGANLEAQLWLDREKLIPPQTTDNDGTATFEVPTGDDGKPAPGGVSIIAPGFGFNNALLSGQNVEVHLEPGTTWRGKVVDEAGKPIAGAKVNVTGAILERDWGNMRRLFGEKHSAAYSVTTGTDGAFAIADVPAKMQLMFGVEHPDYANLGGNGVDPTVEKTITLQPGGKLHGRVVDLAGKPMAKVSVYASLSNHGGGNDGTTDENGVYTVASLAAGVYKVGVYDETLKKNAMFVFPRVSGVSVEVGKTSEAPDLRAVEGVVIEGTVRDAATHKPLPNADVIAQTDEDTSGSGLSDATGHFSFRVVAGRYKAYISGAPTGYQRPTAQKDVDASAAAPAPLLFDLTKATVLRGTIVDEAGKPLQAKIKIDYDSSIKSDATGHWEYTPRKIKLCNWRAMTPRTAILKWFRRSPSRPIRREKPPLCCAKSRGRSCRGGF